MIDMIDRTVLCYIPFIQVRLLSARAACTFITECLGETNFKKFAELYPGILEV
jgi:hypothetical protein